MYRTGKRHWLLKVGLLLAMPIWGPVYVMWCVVVEDCWAVVSDWVDLRYGRWEK